MKIEMKYLLSGGEEQSKSRNIGLDLLKILACFGIVGLHTLGKDSSELNRILYYGGGYSIPVFLMVHGYFLLNRQGMSYRYLMGKAVRMMMIAFAWNCIFAVMQLVAGKNAINPCVETLTELFIQKGVFYQFWFFGSLIILYLLTPWLWNQIKKNNISLLIALFVVSIIVDGVSMVWSLKKGEPIQSYIHQPLRLWTWLMYYYLGGILMKTIKNLPRKINVIHLVGVIVINLVYEYFVGYRIFNVQFAEYFYDNIFMVLEAICLFLIFSNIKVENIKMRVFTMKCSSLTMGVYVLHMVFYRILRTIYGFENGWMNIAIWVSVFLGSMVVTAVIKKLPFLHYLVEI